MPTIADIRQQYPQYNDLSDDQLADSLHKKFYSDMPREQFDAKVGSGQQFGITDTWPFRIGKAAVDAAKLPGDVYTGKQNVNAPNITGRALNFAGWASPVNPGIMAGDRAIPGMAMATKTVSTKAPTEEALHIAADSGFDTFRNSGLKINPDIANRFGSLLRKHLEGKGFRAKQAKGTFAEIKDLETAQEPLDAADLHSSRMALNNVNKPSDKKAARIGIDKLDQFIQGLPQEGFVAGTSPQAIKTAKEAFTSALGNYASAKRSGRLNELEENIERRTAAANSGRNLDNTYRQKLASLLASKTAKRGFSKEELDAADAIVKGGPLVNRARDVGNYFGGGGGLGAHIATTTGTLAGAVLGAHAGGPVEGGVGAVIGGSVFPAIGAVSKSLENRLTQGAYERLGESVRKRSPLYKEGPQTQDLVVSPQKRAALARALLSRQPQPTMTPDQIQAYQAGNLS